MKKIVSLVQTKKIMFASLLLLVIGSMNAQIKIGDNVESISSYSLLEMESTTQGLLLPRMTTAQRDSAFNQDTPVGMVIFNTDINSIQFYMEEVDASFRRTGLKVWVSTTETKIESGLTPPESAVVGNLFYETENGTLYFYNGTEWVAVNLNSSNNIGSSTVFEDNSITYTQSDGSTATLNLEALQTSSGTASQTLSLTGNILEISDGNSVDLEPLLSAYSLTTTMLTSSSNSGTDSQTLTASALSANNTMTLAISNGNTVTLDFSSISGGTGTDSQTLALASSFTTSQTSLSISDGNAISLTASGSISFNQTGTDTLEIVGSQTELLPSSGTVTDSTLRWDGSDWVANEAFLSNGSNQSTLTADFNVTGVTTLATTTLTGALLDSNGSSGLPGQLLSSTGSKTNWITTSSGVTLTLANYIASIDDGSILAQPSSSLTITLPSPGIEDNGKTLSVKRINAYAGTGDLLLINSPVLIDQSTNFLNLNVSFQGYLLQAFGGNWYIIQRF